MGVALGVAILMQIAYPLVDGYVLQSITIISVYLGGIAMFLHGVAAFGARYGWSLFGVTLVFGFGHLVNTPTRQL
jgi:putative membrane protein